MLRITEKTAEKLVVKKIPVPLYFICMILCGIGIGCWILLYPITGLLGRLLGLVIVVATIMVFIFLWEIRSITVSKPQKVLYYTRRGLFRIRVKKYYFFEINKIDLKEEKQQAIYDIIMEKSTGSRKSLLKTRNLPFAREAFELIRTYLV